MNSCGSNQDLDIQLDSEADAEVTLMDTTTTTSTDAAAEVMATDHTCWLTTRGVNIIITAQYKF